jgi:Cu/Ag efflux pump CusA
VNALKKPGENQAAAGIANGGDHHSWAVTVAIGLNIDFVTLFTEFDPNIYFGGDNAMFWGPLATAVVFGLAFATLITLLVVPAMYQIAASTQAKIRRRR